MAKPSVKAPPVTYKIAVFRWDDPRVNLVLTRGLKTKEDCLTQIALLLGKGWEQQRPNLFTFGDDIAVYISLDRD